MKCWNCGKKIPNSAQVCEFCEAEVQAEPTPERWKCSGDSRRDPEDALNELHELNAAERHGGRIRQPALRRRLPQVRQS